MNDARLKIILIIVFFFLAILLVFAIIYLAGKPSVPPEQAFPAPTVVQLKDSAYNKFVPGKSTYSEVIKALGTPYSTKKIGNKTYILYSTGYPSAPNQFVFVNDVLLYDIENFFEDYKKPVSYYTGRYGNPEATLYDKNDESLEWLIFPKQGIALAVFVFESSIVKILYFEPQTLQQFETIFLNELNLTKEKEIEVIEVDPSENEVFAPEIQNPSPTPAP